jgi:endonuclease G
MNSATRGPVRDSFPLSSALEQTIKRLRTDDVPRQASPKQVLRRQLALATVSEDTDAADRRVERILAGNDLTDIGYLALGLQRAKSVGRIVIRVDERTIGYGSGFLVAAGILLTNWHVLKSESLVRGSAVQFRYERDHLGRELQYSEFRLRLDPPPIIHRELDIALVAVEPESIAGESLDLFGWLPLDPNPGKAFVGEYLTIIQHPGGERKQLCVRENKLLKMNANSPFLWYQTDTVGGSSGSPVFNDSWEVVALHHSSVPRMKRIEGQDYWLTRDGQIWTEDMGDDAVDWIANEGVRLSWIHGYLERKYPDHPLSRAVREATDPPEESAAAGRQPSSIARPVQFLPGPSGTARVYVPIDISIGAYAGAEAPRHAPAFGRAPRDTTPGLTAAAALMEKVEIDTSNYVERDGYDSLFLGDGLKVPLPKVTADAPGTPLKLSGSQTELKYWTYSVVMNRARGLAYFSAANIRPKHPDSKQSGNQFIRDSRVDSVDEAAQIGQSFYKKQSEFEAEDRTLNPFDQGHLTRREDLQWGHNLQTAKRNGDDSFHYTNCAPQHFLFNQNRKASGIWYRLEVAATKELSVGENLCVINGPIFDAPRCVPGPDGKLRLNLDGPGKKDPKFGGFSIPKMFFKLIAYNDNGQLRAKAFVVTQEELLDTIDRIHVDEAVGLTDEEIRLYQVAIPQLQTLTGLKFGLPASAFAPLPTESIELVAQRPVESLAEVRFV